MKLRALLLFAPLFFALNDYGYATHIVGMNITYECLGNNTYVLRGEGYSECSSTLIIGGFNLRVTSTCGDDYTTQLSLIPESDTGKSYTLYDQLCVTDLGVCNGGAFNQYKRMVSVDTVYLDPGCIWTFSYEGAEKLDFINLNSSSGTNWIRTTLDPSKEACNNSPLFDQNNPIIYACVGQKISHYPIQMENDNNNLRYRFYPASKSMDGTIIENYKFPYQYDSPIAGSKLDSLTGIMSFTPSEEGNYLVVLDVEEYNDSFELIGITQRYFTVAVFNCTNSAPTANDSFLTVSGNGTATDSLSIEACEGEQFCFELLFKDIDGDSLFLSNVDQINAFFPNALVTQTLGDSIIVEICINTNGLSGSYNFPIIVRDNACPVTANTYSLINLNVLGGVATISNTTICNNQSVVLESTGSSTSYTWSVISGDPIQIGGNFSCNPCANPEANPVVTTTYEVMGISENGCVSSDTVTLNVAPDFLIDFKQNNDSICKGDTIKIDNMISPTGNYSFSWCPLVGLDNANIGDPKISPNVGGDLIYFVHVTSPEGCVLHDSILLHVDTAVPHFATVTADLKPLGCAEEAQLDVIVKGPDKCFDSFNPPSPCSAIDTVKYGQRENTSIDQQLPVLFANASRSTRQQFLYKASLLNQNGFIGGVIEGISIDVLSIPGDSTFKNFTIKMGCTDIESLENQWGPVSDIITVLPSSDIKIDSGANVIQFLVPYEWDGKKNLLIEICQEDLGKDPTSNAEVYTTNAGYWASRIKEDNLSSACNSLTADEVSRSLPDIKFLTCLPKLDPDFYSYVWTPNLSLTDDSIRNPISKPKQTIEYTVVVTNNVNGCKTVKEFVMAVGCGDCKPAGYGVVYPTCSDSEDGKIIIKPVISQSKPINIVLTNAKTGEILFSINNVSSTDSIIVSDLNNGDYIITIEEPTEPCTKDTWVELRRDPIHIALAKVNDIVCTGESNGSIFVAALGGEPGYTYQWDISTGNQQGQQLNDLFAGVYTVSITDANGCEAEASFNVREPEPIVIGMLIDKSCPGGSPGGVIDLDLSGGAGGYSVYWPSSGTNGEVLENVPEGIYTYIITDSKNCQYIGNALVGVYDLKGNASSINANCGNSDGSVSVTPSGDNLPFDITWSTNAGGGSSSTNINLPAGEYFATIVDSKLCTVTERVVIQNNSIFAEFVATPIKGTVPLTTTFTNKSVGANNFTWIFGDGNGANGTSLSEEEHTYTSPGLYQAVLFVCKGNDPGCCDSTSVFIKVEDQPYLKVPNVFTPNGDNVNDQFLIKGEGFVGFRASIYNRWGKKIYEWGDINTGWRGINEAGSFVPGGTYYWTVTLTTFDHKFFERSGQLTLIR